MAEIARGPRLRIVAINDVYTLENLPRLQNLIKHYREANPADKLLVTLAGDFVSPSLLSSLDAGRGMVECMNALGVTHVTFGNHEDDISTDELRKRVRELSATWLATNVRDFDPPLPASEVIEVSRAGGRTVRVGLVGVVMDDPAVYRRKPFGGGEVSPPNEAARREAVRLIAEGCSCVIPLTHQPIADDHALAQSNEPPRFPVIVGGHEHDVHLEQIHGTWVEKAGSDATHAVVIDLEWPASAPPIGAPDPCVVSIALEDAARFEEDPSLRARVDALMKPVRAIEKATLYRLTPGEVLTSIGTRREQTSMGALFCSRVRDALGAEGCLFNGGGIRGAHEYHHHITFGDIKAEVPFENEVVVVTLPGRVVREAVAQSRSHAPAESGSFLQIDDRMAVDGPEGLVSAIDGAPIDLDRDYRIAVIRDLLIGLDHVEPLVAFARAHPERVPPPGSGRDVKMLLVGAFCIALWRRLGAFDTIDTNHDGVVSEPEVTAAIARILDEPPSPLGASLVMHALDHDHDEGISRAEALAAAPRAKPPAEDT